MQKHKYMRIHAWYSDLLCLYHLLSCNTFCNLEVTMDGKRQGPQDHFLKFMGYPLSIVVKSKCFAWAHAPTRYLSTEPSGYVSSLTPSVPNLVAVFSLELVPRASFDVLDGPSGDILEMSQPQILWRGQSWSMLVYLDLINYFSIHHITIVPLPGNQNLRLIWYKPNESQTIPTLFSQNPIANH